MKLIEAAGTPRQVGRHTGEQLRDEIKEHIEMVKKLKNLDRRKACLPPLYETVNHELPDVFEEIRGTAEGARATLDDILLLNLPFFPNELDVMEQCTNIVFTEGPDGPIWGKNNDGQHQRPHCARLVRRNDAIPVVVFTFCGMIATLDAMNAEGLATGHSSVGSIFQQSERFVPIRLWAYEGMMRCRTAQEFIRHMVNRPTRGKGYSILCVDRNGAACSIEAPCPLVQVRLPEPECKFIHCVNCYQLPILADADLRSEDGKRNALARWKLLDEKISAQNSLNLEKMKELLRFHGEPSICRHGGKDQSYTEYSMIGLPQTCDVLYLSGNPCEGEFKRVSPV